MASRDRQERRKKIMERGSDRLALITGQIQNLSESPSSTPTHKHHVHTESSPSIMFSPDDPSKNIAGLNGSESAATNKLMKLRTVSAVPESQNYGSPIIPTSQFRPSSLNPQKILETQEQLYEAQKPVTNSYSETNTKQIQESMVVTTQLSTPNPSNHHQTCFSSRRVNASIIASEKFRAICSLIIAFLVIMANMDHPLFEMKIVSSDSFIVAKPLYIILITDITIVLARLFREIETDGSEEGEGGRKEIDEDNWDGAVKLLERGFVLYQAIRGIFIDSSVYLVVVICGLSLL